MLRTLEASIDKTGVVRLLEPVQLPATRRALVTILDEEVPEANETAKLSEAALSDWNRPEEDEAWTCLDNGGNNKNNDINSKE